MSDTGEDGSDSNEQLQIQDQKRAHQRAEKAQQVQDLIIKDRAWFAAEHKKRPVDRPMPGAPAQVHLSQDPKKGKRSLESRPKEKQVSRVEVEGSIASDQSDDNAESPPKCVKRAPTRRSASTHSQKTKKNQRRGGKLQPHSEDSALTGSDSEENSSDCDSVQEDHTDSDADPRNQGDEEREDSEDNDDDLVGLDQEDVASRIISELSATKRTQNLFSQQPSWKSLSPKPTQPTLALSAEPPSDYGILPKPTRPALALSAEPPLALSAEPPLALSAEPPSGYGISPKPSDQRSLSPPTRRATTVRISVSLPLSRFCIAQTHPPTPPKVASSSPTPYSLRRGNQKSSQGSKTTKRDRVFQGERPNVIQPDLRNDSDAFLNAKAKRKKLRAAPLLTATAARTKPADENDDPAAVAADGDQESAEEAWPSHAQLLVMYSGCRNPGVGG
ncbi:hypothetical protein HYPSUDRAFT_58625 [Hypholoma sublateritium FD-334 SS-4]|uniref:Uncharacterized protein n=1 Tax=Hypholoma sublateritium (strain FD-334 SS-4) TaxID=945553 RepID=A0A0D2LY40_HYPSF|nr:hypothetical protein HYPSUDRAFT_58625 [Hypholoma sublateritium FD-334 SS-4]